MLSSQRHLYDIPDDVTYLNCAYMSPLSHAVVAAMRTGIDCKVRPWSFSPNDFFTHSEDARGLFARLIGGSSEDIAIVPAASYGLTTAARVLPVGAGQEILVLADQFPSNVYPFRERARQASARIRTVERPSDGDWTTAIINRIGGLTAIVAVPNCHWTDGGVVDLVRIGDAIRAVGAALVLDLTQSLGAFPFDVAAVRPDFMACAGYTNG